MYLLVLSWIEINSLKRYFTVPTLVQLSAYVGLCKFMDIYTDSGTQLLYFSRGFRNNHGNKIMKREYDIYRSFFMLWLKSVNVSGFLLQWGPC